MSTLTPLSHSIGFPRGTLSRKASGHTITGVTLTLLMAALFSAPLAFGAVPLLAWTVCSGAFVLLAAIWVSLTAFRGPITIVLPPFLVSAVALIALGAIQIVTHRSVNVVGTQEALFKLAACVSITFLVVQLMSNTIPATWYRVGIAITVYSFALSLFAVVQFFATPEQLYFAVRPRWGGWVFGPYVSHNHYAGLMDLLIPLVIGTLLALPRGHVLRPFTAFAALLSVLSVLVSGSRSGAIAVAVELILFGILSVSHRRYTSKRQRYANSWTIFAFIPAAILLMIALDVNEVSARWQRLVRSPQAELETRNAVAHDTTRMWLANPVWGAGLGAFEDAYPRYQSFATDLLVDHAHNDYLEFLAEAGAIGGIVVALGIMHFALISLRRMVKEPVWSVNWAHVAPGLSIVGILVHSFSDFNLHIPANAFWCAACIGFFSAKSSSLIFVSAPGSEPHLQRSTQQQIHRTAGR